MTDKEFVQEYAKLVRVPEKQARELVRLFRGLLVAGVHSSGSVSIDGLGRFYHVWHVPVGGNAAAGHRITNKMRFKPGMALNERMNKWAGAPGFSKRKRKEMAESAKAVAAETPMQDQTYTGVMNHDNQR